MLVSAKTGEGIDELRAGDRGSGCPSGTSWSGSACPTAGATWWPGRTPRARSTRAEHGPDGTLLEARVPPELAAELEQYAVV